MGNVGGKGLGEEGGKELGGEILGRHKLLPLSDPYLHQATELCHNKHDDIPNCDGQQPGCLEYRFHARGSLKRTQVCE